MYDTNDASPSCVPNKTCGSNMSPVFFLFYMMITRYVMLNLFILVIIQQFEMYYLVDDNILQRFRDDLQCFKTSWAVYSKEYQGLSFLLYFFVGIKVKSMDLLYFFKKMQGNLSMSHESNGHVMRNIVKMNLER